MVIVARVTHQPGLFFQCIWANKASLNPDQEIPKIIRITITYKHYNNNNNNNNNENNNKKNNNNSNDNNNKNNNSNDNNNNNII